MRISDNIYVNLDLVPPDVSGDSSGTNVVLYGNQLQSNDNNGFKVVSWTENKNGTANAAACFDLIQTQALSSVKVVAGDTYCYKTNQGNIAIMKALQAPVDNSGNINSALVQATIWSSEGN